MREMLEGIRVYKIAPKKINLFIWFKYCIQFVVESCLRIAEYVFLNICWNARSMYVLNSSAISSISNYIKLIKIIDKQFL